jgi:hypothetical protein
VDKESGKSGNADWCCITGFLHIEMPFVYKLNLDKTIKFDNRGEEACRLQKG